MNMSMWLCLSRHCLVCVGTGDFLNEFHMYEDLRDLNTLKAFMETQLDDYNQTPGLVPMSLVLFRDAFEHSASKTQHTAHTLAPDRAEFLRCSG